MIRRRYRPLCLAALAAAGSLQPLVSHACSACYGDPSSSLSKGLVWGISSLLVVVVSVLAGITTFFVFVARKNPADKDKV